MSTYLSVKLREGMARIAEQYPHVDFGASSPGMSAAEDELGRVCHRWHQSFATTTAEVARAFHRWEQELLKANRIQVELFA